MRVSRLVTYIECPVQTKQVDIKSQYSPSYLVYPSYGQQIVPKHTVCLGIMKIQKKELSTRIESMKRFNFSFSYELFNGGGSPCNNLISKCSITSSKLSSE